MKLPIKTLLIFILAVLSGALLLYTSQTVQDAQRDLAYKTHMLQKEKEALAALRAEWSFLSAPERLQRIAEEDLGMSLDTQGAVMPDLKTVNETIQKTAPQQASHPGGQP